MKARNLTFVSFILVITLHSCNQVSKPPLAKPSPQSASEFKDSTSFVKGVKVFVKALAQMKVIENVTLKQGKHYYLIGGKLYEASDLRSLD